MRSFLRHLLRLAAEPAQISASILWITYSNTTKWKQGSNTFARAELNRVAFVYFKTGMEKVLYIEARRRQGVS